MNEIVHAMHPSLSRQTLCFTPEDALAKNERVANEGEHITCDKCLRIVMSEPKMSPSNAYYDVGGISVIDFIRAKLTPAQLQGYYLGNVLKYAGRLNHKLHGAQAAKDAAKLAEYAVWLSETYHADESTEV